MKWYVEEDSDIHKMKSSVPLEVCASAIILGMRMMNFYMRACCVKLYSWCRDNRYTASAWQFQELCEFFDIFFLRLSACSFVIRHYEHSFVLFSRTLNFLFGMLFFFSSIKRTADNYWSYFPEH